jgi:hypothetical protein
MITVMMTLILISRFLDYKWAKKFYPQAKDAEIVKGVIIGGVIQTLMVAFCMPIAILWVGFNLAYYAWIWLKQPITA